MSGREIASVIVAALGLATAVVQTSGKHEAEAVTADVIRAVSASLEGWEPCERH